MELAKLLYLANYSVNEADNANAAKWYGVALIKLSAVK